MMLKRIYQELSLIRKELQAIRSILEFNKEYVAFLKARKISSCGSKKITSREV